MTANITTTTETIYRFTVNGHTVTLHPNKFKFKDGDEKRYVATWPSYANLTDPAALEDLADAMRAAAAKLRELNEERTS
jgi:CO/xanthine dehydrogenase Mo-binding subunit